jgi:hypothetical protein
VRCALVQNLLLVLFGYHLDRYRKTRIASAIFKPRLASKFSVAKPTFQEQSSRKILRLPDPERPHFQKFHFAAQ